MKKALVQFAWECIESIGLMGITVAIVVITIRIATV